MYVRIKKLREKYRLSQKQLADYLNISVKLYDEYESGKKRIPIQILSKLSQKYCTSIDYIIEDTDEIIPHKPNN